MNRALNLDRARGIERNRWRLALTIGTEIKEFSHRQAKNIVKVRITVWKRDGIADLDRDFFGAERLVLLIDCMSFSHSEGCDQQRD